MLVYRLLVSQSLTTMLVYRAEQVASLKHFPRSPNIVRTPLTTWFKASSRETLNANTITPPDSKMTRRETLN